MGGIADVVNPSFLGTTKMQILVLLRRAPRTIHELATALNLTDNAVRAHIVALERDRLVERVGHRSGLRKPSVSYTLAGAGDQLFAKPYGEVLDAVLDRLEQRHGTDEVAQIMREIGRQLARERPSLANGRPKRERLGTVAEFITGLGGMAEVEEHADHFVLTSYSCPIATVVPGHPQACQLTQAFIEELLRQGTVRERCQRGDELRCVFEIEL
jgi:predicted ArsR family transcriptional regulator